VHQSTRRVCVCVCVRVCTYMYTYVYSLVSHTLSPPSPPSLCLAHTHRHGRRLTRRISTWRMLSWPWATCTTSGLCVCLICVVYALCVWLIHERMLSWPWATCTTSGLCVCPICVVYALYVWLIHERMLSWPWATCTTSGLCVCLICVVYALYVSCTSYMYGLYTSESEGWHGHGHRVHRILVL